ncbi:hypothetical protein RhiLY_12289 [Ceratobasidium sp. AG-Ba]|nr:hypothetical protein RhiLY_12289 [Ceratobasidium sp. AG-Ba]
MPDLPSSSPVDLPPIAVKLEEPDTRDEDDLGSAAGPGTSDQDELKPPAPKRIRNDKTSPKLSKRVRGKQGGLKGLMNMPIDIFTQIVHWLNPGDLIALIGRSDLASGGEQPRWTATLSTRPERTTICRFAILKILHFVWCKFDGQAGHKLTNKILHVLSRQLVEVKMAGFDDLQDSALVPCSTNIKLGSSGSRPRGGLDSPVCLKSEVKQVNKIRQRFRAAKDNDGWIAWKTARHKTVLERYKYAVRICTYIHSIEKSRGKELIGVRRNRRETIIRRLIDLGWTNHDMICDREHVKVWRALVEVSKPLTERIWTNILPKLILLLEENRARHLEADRLARYIQRCDHIDEFLIGMKFSENPLEPIAKALGAQLPVRPDPNAPHDLLAPEDPAELMFGNPFPNTQLALTWDCLADLSEREISIGELEKELDARKDRIRLKILEWRAGIERQLVEQYRSEFDHRDKDPIVQGSPHVTSNLSPELRLLLRADTVFMNCEANAQGNCKGSRLLDYRGSYFYPRLVCDLRDIFDYNQPLENPVFDLYCYRKHVGLGSIIESLLQSLGMPDVARLELLAMGARFVCGRCADEKSMTWDETVEHYVRELRKWDKNKDNEPVTSVRYPITYRNVHHLDAQDNPKPLVRVVTVQEAHRLLNPPPDVPKRLCIMCDATERNFDSRHPDAMVVHMQDVHGITTPVEGVHWAMRISMDTLFDEWPKKWNAFYDGRASGL